MSLRVLLVDINLLVFLDRCASALGPDLEVLEDLHAGARGEAPGEMMSVLLASLDSVFDSSVLLDEAILVRDEPVGIEDLLLRIMDDAVCCVLGERYEERLLRFNGEDTGDGSEGREEVCDELHRCGVMFCFVLFCCGVVW